MTQNGDWQQVDLHRIATYAVEGARVTITSTRAIYTDFVYVIKVL